jgi:hypothetical protein
LVLFQRQLTCPPREHKGACILGSGIDFSRVLCLLFPLNWTTSSSRQWQLSRGSADTSCLCMGLLSARCVVDEPIDATGPKLPFRISCRCPQSIHLQRNSCGQDDRYDGQLPSHRRFGLSAVVDALNVVLWNYLTPSGDRLRLDLNSLSLELSVLCAIRFHGAAIMEFRAEVNQPGVREPTTPP